MSRQFKGTIKLDIRDSKPDWDAFLYQKAPKDAPNVLVILYDDTGCAAWSPYGGRINMPTMDRLAANGLTYTQWHTTAVCSPTRSTFLTGRNHHANGFGSISEMAVGFPGYCGHIPPENGIGTDSGDSVSSEYKPKFEFTGGRVIKVIFDVAKDVYVNVEKAMAASMARD